MKLFGLVPSGFRVTSGRQFLRLENRVRKVASFHVCDDLCEIYITTKSVTHIASMLNGGFYKIAGRKDGFPPHLG